MLRPKRSNLVSMASGWGLMVEGEIAPAPRFVGCAYISSALDHVGVRRILSRWDGHAGLVYFHLLLDRLAETVNLGETRSEAHGDSGALHVER